MLLNLQSQSIKKIAALVGILTGSAIPLRATGVAVEQGALGLALMGALFIWCAVPEARKRVYTVLVSPIGLSVAVMFACWAVGIVFSFDPLGSLRIGGRTVVMVLAAVVLWVSLKQHMDAHRLMLKVLVLFSLSIALGVILSFNGVIMTVVHPDMAFKPFAASVMCLVPAVVWAGRKLDGGWRWGGYGFVPLALVIIVQTFNRAALAGFIALILTVGLVLILNKHRFARGWLVVIVAATLGGLVYIFTREMHTPVVDGLYLPRWLVDPHRQYIWQFAFESFLESPWVGTGIDQSNYIPGAGLPAPGFDGHTATLPSHPHNGVLEILTETGLLGFLPFVFVIGGTFWRLLKRSWKSSDEANMALLVLMAGFWSSALFNFSIWSTWWQLTLYTLFAVIASGREAECEEREPQ